MLPYDPRLKGKARSLRAKLTDAEQRLWARLRRKQILGGPQGQCINQQQNYATGRLHESFASYLGIVVEYTS